MQTTKTRTKRTAHCPDADAWARLDEQLAAEDAARAARLAAKIEAEEFDPIAAWLDSAD